MKGAQNHHWLGTWNKAVTYHTRTSLCRKGKIKGHWWQNREIYYLIMCDEENDERKERVKKKKIVITKTTEENDLILRNIWV